MQITEALIKKFFERKCTPEEADAVADWLAQHPQEANAWYSQEEWAQEPGAELSEEEWDHIWQELRQQRKRTNLRRILYAAAACMAAVILYLPFYRKMNGNTTLQAVKEPVNIQDSVVLRNTSDTALRVWLEDGTRVDLHSDSRIAYSKTTWLQARQLVAEGEVAFDVAKDKVRPFIVRIGSLSVQALGTVFSVRQRQDDPEPRIRLYEGKVKVVPVAAEANAGTILEPGQELVWASNGPKLQYFLHGQHEQLFVKKNSEVREERLLVPAGWYEFTNQPVESVFRTLEILYGITIHYQKKQVAKLFFIGRFEKTDAPDLVLESIALLNNLRVEKKSATQFYIYEKDH